MPFSKKTLTWIFVIVAIVVIGAVLIYVFRCSIFNLDSCVADPNESNEPVPPGSGSPKWVQETFPLNVGMYGSKIKALQTKLSISADGKFGTQTKSAVIAAGKTVPLSEADYNAIINPAATGGGSNFQALKQALSGGSTNFSSGISYLVPGQNKNYRFDFYTNGRFFINTSNANDNLFKGTYSNGGKKMVIDGGSTYENSVVQANLTNIINNVGE